MERRDWVLLALSAAANDRLQPVQLQKSLFLLGERVPKLGTDFYKFYPYHYGPFAREIYDDADALAAEGLVSIRRRPGSTWREYCATRDGLERAEQIASEVNPRAWAYLQRAVRWTEELTFEEVVRSIYAHFPKYRSNSVFQE